MTPQVYRLHGTRTVAISSDLLPAAFTTHSLKWVRSPQTGLVAQEPSELYDLSQSDASYLIPIGAMPAMIDLRNGQSLPQLSIVTDKADALSDISMSEEFAGSQVHIAHLLQNRLPGFMIQYNRAETQLATIVQKIAEGCPRARIWVLGITRQVERLQAQLATADFGEVVEGNSREKRVTIALPSRQDPSNAHRVDIALICDPVGCLSRIAASILNMLSHARLIGLLEGSAPVSSHDQARLELVYGSFKVQFGGGSALGEVIRVRFDGTSVRRSQARNSLEEKRDLIWRNRQRNQLILRLCQQSSLADFQMRPHETTLVLVEGIAHAWQLLQLDPTLRILYSGLIPKHGFSTDERQRIADRRWRTDEGPPERLIVTLDASHDAPWDQRCVAVIAHGLPLAMEDSWIRRARDLPLRIYDLDDHQTATLRLASRTRLHSYRSKGLRIVPVVGRSTRCLSS